MTWQPNDILGKLENQQNRLTNYYFGRTNGGGAGSYVNVTLANPINGRNTIEAYCADSIPPGECFVYRFGDTWEVKSPHSAREIRTNTHLQTRRRAREEVQAKWAGLILCELKVPVTEGGVTLPRTQSYNLYYRENNTRPILVASLPRNGTGGEVFDPISFIGGDFFLHFIDRTKTLVEWRYSSSISNLSGSTVRLTNARYLITNGVNVEPLPFYTVSSAEGSGDSWIVPPNNQSSSEIYKEYYTNRLFDGLGNSEVNPFNRSPIPEAYFGQVFRYFNLNPDPPFEPPDEGLYWRAISTDETVFENKSYIPIIKDPNLLDFLNTSYFTPPEDNVYPVVAIPLQVRKGTGVNDIYPSLNESATAEATVFGIYMDDLAPATNDYYNSPRQVEVWEIGNTVVAESWESGRVVQPEDASDPDFYLPGVNYSNWRSALRARRLSRVRVDISLNGLLNGLQNQGGVGGGQLVLRRRTYKVAIF